MPTCGTAIHAERARLVGHDRHDVLAELLVLEQLGSMRTKAMVVETSRPPEPSRNSAKSRLRRGDLERRTGRRRCGKRAAERLAALAQVAHFLGAVLRRPVEGRLADLVVGDGDAEPVAELRSSSSLSFFCWWVMFGPRRPRPCRSP
jgi:hypothetical protein